MYALRFALAWVGFFVSKSESLKLSVSDFQALFSYGSALISHGFVGSPSFIKVPADNASIVENETPTLFVVVAGCNPSCCEISESITERRRVGAHCVQG